MISIYRGSTQVSSEFHPLLEDIERAYWMKYYQGESILPTYASTLSGGMAFAIPDLDILAMNRVLGIRAIDNEILQQIISFYKNAGSSRFFIQLPPNVVSKGAQETLLENGFRFHNNWSKLFRKVEPLTITTNDELVIREIDKRESYNYGQLIFMSFDWPDTRLAEWLASTVGQSGYKNYIVSWQGKDIAAGALYVSGAMASMAFAGTLEQFRGKGAQSLLLKTRMRDAVDLGATFITAETAEHSEVKPVRSYLNMKKVGFQDAYLRQNWIYHLDDQ